MGLAFIDWRLRVEFREVIELSGEADADLGRLRAFYRACAAFAPSARGRSASGAGSERPPRP